MTPDRRPRPRSFAGALAQFHETVHDDLDAALTYLDLADWKLVEAWGTLGHDDRRSAYDAAKALATKTYEEQR